MDRFFGNEYFRLRVGTSVYVHLEGVEASDEEFLIDLLEISDCRDVAIEALLHFSDAASPEAIVLLKRSSDEFLAFAIARWWQKGCSQLASYISSEGLENSNVILDFPEHPSLDRLREFIGALLSLLRIAIASDPELWADFPSLNMDWYNNLIANINPFEGLYRSIVARAALNPVVPSFDFLFRPIVELPIITDSIRKNIANVVGVTYSPTVTVQGMVDLHRLARERVEILTKLTFQPYSYAALVTLTTPSVNYSEILAGFLEAQTNQYLKTFSNLQFPPFTYSTDIASALLSSTRFVPDNLTGLVPTYDVLLKHFQRSAENDLAFIRAHGHLDDAGYGFLIGHLSFRAASQISSYQSGNRSGVITKRLRDLTASEEYARHLEIAVRSSVAGESIWPNLAQALHAHRRRDYFTSVTALLPICEMMIVARLEQLDLVFRKSRGKLVRKLPDGTLRRTGNKYVYFSGLNDKIEHLRSHASNRSNIPDWTDSCRTKTGSLIDTRNWVLHGNSFKVANAQRSTQLILLVYFLANELADRAPRRLM